MLRCLNLFWLAGLLVLGACASSDFSGLKFGNYDDRPPEAGHYRDFMVARIASMTNDPEAAARRYASVLDAVPEPATIAERAVFSALLAGDYPLAAGLSRRAADVGSEASLIRLTQAVDLIARGQAAKAGPVLEDGDFRPFNRGIVRNLLAWRALEKDGLSTARVYIEEGMSGDPAYDSPSLYMLAQLQLAAKDDERALQTFEKVWQSGARLAIGVEAHAELLASGGQREAALEIIRSFQNEVGANAALADLARRIEAGDQIRVRRLTTRQGAALSIYVPAAALLYQTGDDLAAVYFTLVLALDPDLHIARALWAQALYNAERYEDAMRLLQAVPRSSPYYSNARGQMASVLHASGQSEAALQVAAEALAGNPDRGLRLQLADLYIALERYEEGEAALDVVLQEDEARGHEDWRVIFARGAARERQGKWEGAEADLLQALSLRPDSATVLNYLGYSWIDRGLNLEEGFELIRQAMLLEPTSGHIVDSLGWAHYKLGEYEEAVLYLEQAVELLPGDPILNDHLGDAYWRVGRRLEAGYQWRRALKLEPEEADRVQIEAKLASPLGPDAPGVAAALTSVSD